MRKSITSIVLGFSFWFVQGLPLVAEETPAPPIVPPPAGAEPEAPAEAPAPEEKPYDPVTDYGKRFQTLATEHPLISTTPLAAQWQALLKETAAAQIALAAAKDAPLAERAELQIAFDDHVSELERLATSAEVTAGGMEITAKLDEHKTLPGIAGPRAMLVAVQARVDAALFALHEAQRAAQRKRQDSTRLQTQGEIIDQRAEAAIHAVDTLNDEVGKIDEQLEAEARRAQRTALRARIAAAVVSAHAMQREALHARQQGELIGLAADALDDQANAAEDTLNAERETFGTAVDGISAFIDQGGAQPPEDGKKNGADNL